MFIRFYNEYKQYTTANMAKVKRKEKNGVCEMAGF